MTVETIDTLAVRARADELLAAVTESNRAWEGTVERLRSLRRLSGRKPGACALHETIAAARPAMLAALQRALGGTLLVIVPTPDAAERSFADLLYYLGDRNDRVALLRSREEGAGAIESPSETSARTTLLADLTDGLPRIVLAPISAPVAIFVRPRSTVNGWTVTSASISTVGSIHVVFGSTIVTPASMCASLIRSRRTAPACASSTRVFTPSVSRESAAM